MAGDGFPHVRSGITLAVLCCAVPLSMTLGRLVMWLENDHDLQSLIITVCIMTVIFGTVAGYKIQHWDTFSG